jgi:hypothetical protein
MADDGTPTTDDAATGPQDPVDEPTSTFEPSSDATAAMPVAGETGALRASETTQRVTPLIWAARVPIRPADAPLREAAPPEWQEADGDADGGDGDNRAWVRPAVITCVVVVLLAMFGTGIWLIFKRTDDRAATAPGISSAASATAAAPSDTAVPSDTATATEDPTPTVEPTTADAPVPPPVAPTTTAQVPVPDVLGKTEAVARQQLTAKGLTVKVTTRLVSGASVGKVISTDPKPGAVVDKGTQVNVVVGKAQPPTGSPSPTGNVSPAVQPVTS